MNSTKKIAVGVIAALTSSTAMAGGLERGTWSPNILYEEGNYLELSWGRVNPSVTGLAGGIIPISNINPDYDQINFGLKLDLSDQLAISLTSYEPSGYDLQYPVTFVTPTPTSAHVESRAYAAVAKYQATENFSLYGGINYVTVSGSAGNLPGTFAGLDFRSDSDIGYILGAAYSKPEIALRVAFTYESGTSHSLSTGFSPVVGGPYTYGLFPNTIGGTPEAYTLDFQTGIAADTLLFGRFRHAVHSDADIILGGSANLTKFSDEQTYVLGIGRKINETVSVSLSGTYENGSGSPSDLNPTDGKFTASAGAKFKLSENMELSAGASYTWVGDNVTITGAIPFNNNNALAYGFKVGFRF